MNVVSSEVTSRAVGMTPCTCLGAVWCAAPTHAYPGLELGFAAGASTPWTPAPRPSYTGHTAMASTDRSVDGTLSAALQRSKGTPLAWQQQVQKEAAALPAVPEVPRVQLEWDQQQQLANTLDDASSCASESASSRPGAAAGSAEVPAGGTAPAWAGFYDLQLPAALPGRPATAMQAGQGQQEALRGPQAAGTPLGLSRPHTAAATSWHLPGSASRDAGVLQQRLQELTERLGRQHGARPGALQFDTRDTAGAAQVGLEAVFAAIARTF